MDDPVERYRRALPPGQLRDFETTALDRVGVPVWSVTFYADEGPDAGGHGYGTMSQEARTGAFGEVTEATRTYHALRSQQPRRASYAELRGERGQAGVADPLTLGLEAGTDYRPERPLDWLPATRYRTGEEVLVPAEFLAAQAADLPGGPPPDGWLITPITNGQGAGDTTERAISHGLLELLQRDGNGLSFRALDQGVVLDTSQVTDPDTRGLLDRLDAAGIDVLCKLAATDFGITNVYVVGADRSDAPDPGALAITACGEAAHPDRERALRKALLEYAAARTRKIFTHGPLEPVAEVTPPGYLDEFLARPAGEDEERALRTMVEWLTMTTDELRAELAGSVLSHRSTVPFGALPTVAAGSLQDPVALLDDVLGRLEAEGFDVLVVHYATPENDGVATVKAIVPGLEVETMSYGRIGERGVRRLLDRDSALAGLGAPPAGAAPVALTDQAMERLGGPAWLDVAAVERLVGRLYPLYREPGRHSAPQALARGLAV